MEVTVCLAFPDAYEIGMSHTGTKILYEIVNRRAGWACERTYAPWTDFEAVLRREKVPLFSVESFAPAADFDVLGFSLQSEMNYTNVPNMLDVSGSPSSPRSAATRPDRDRRRTVRRQPRAARGLLRRVPHRRRRGGAARLPGSRRADEGALAPRAPARVCGLPRDLRPVALRRDVRRRFDRRVHPEHAGRSVGGEARLGREALGGRLSRETDGAVRGHHPGPARPRDHARLHAGLPLLPGGLLVPPRARARPRGRREGDEGVHRRGGLERGRPPLALLGGLLADRAARGVPRSRAREDEGLDLAALAARRGVLGRARGRGLRGAQVGIHVRPRDGFGPPAPRHQQDVHERGHGQGGRRRLRARLGHDQGLHDDRAPDGDRFRSRRARDAGEGHPRPGAPARRPPAGERLGRMLRPEELHPVPVVRVRRRREPRGRSPISRTGSVP